MVNSIFFNFFLERKFLFQRSLRQFLFYINRVSFRGDILKKTGEADSIHFLYIFLRNHIFQPKTKNSTGHLFQACVLK